MYTRLQVYKIVFRLERAVEIPVSVVRSNIYYTIYYDIGILYRCTEYRYIIILLYYIPNAVIDDDVAIAPGHVQSCFQPKR